MTGKSLKLRKSVLENNKIYLMHVFSCLLFFLIAGCEQKKNLLPIFKNIPDFSLIDQRSVVFTKKNLKGKIWVGDLIFTRCNDTCPIQSIEMSRLQQEFMNEKLFSQFSVSIDPKFDTPNVLQEYGKRFMANFEKWFFLTGEKIEINKLVKSGLGLNADIVFDQKRRNSFLGSVIRSFFSQNAYAHHPAHKKKTNILHSFRFVLIDTELRVRGYYMSNDKEALNKLRKDIYTLLKLNQ